MVDLIVDWWDWLVENVFVLFLTVVWIMGLTLV